jgi:hypothetical protein
MMTRADFVIVLAAVLFTGGLYGMLWSESGAGQTALIQSGHEAPLRVSLDAGRVLTVHGARGDSVLEIQPGRIRFRDSSCSHKFCVLSGWLSGAGASSACLPNQISIMVAGGPPAYDAINF